MFTLLLLLTYVRSAQEQVHDAAHDRQTAHHDLQHPAQRRRVQFNNCRNGKCEESNVRGGWGRESDFKSPERDGEFTYFASLRGDYKMRIMRDSMYVKVDIRVDPCKSEIETGGLRKNCCQNSNLVACQNHPYNVRGGKDLQIAYFQNAHIPTCDGTPFENDPNCGTFIEIHHAAGEYSEKAANLKGIETGPDPEVEMSLNFNPVVLSDVRLDVEFPNGFQTVYISTHRLCSGWHELWWVVRTLHAGPFVLRRVPFFVYYPSCATPELLEDEKSRAAEQKTGR